MALLNDADNSAWSSRTGGWTWREFNRGSACRFNLTLLMASVAYVFSFAGSVEARDEIQFVAEWGRKGDAPGEFHSPIGLAVSNDTIYVTDVNNSRIQKFDTQGVYLASIHLPKDPPDEMRTSAAGIAIDEGGLVYVTFTDQHLVRVYAEDGTLVRTWGKKGSGRGELLQPGGIVLGPNKSVFVADQGNHRVQRFTHDGECVASWGTHGSNQGQFGGAEKSGSRFGGPHFLAIDKRSRIFTTEGANRRVQRLSLRGKPQIVWGPDDANGAGAFGGLKTEFTPTLHGPVAVMVDAHDRVWVSSLNNRVQAYTPNGKYLMGIGEKGSKRGQFWRPHGMAMDSNGYLYVADSSNQRIQKFKVSGSTDDEAGHPETR